MDNIGKKECCCQNRTKQRTQEEHKALMNRLNRIEGQIRGIKGMVEKDAYCTDIITQVAAARAALNDIKAGKEETVDDLLETLQKLMK